MAAEAPAADAALIRRLELLFADSNVVSDERLQREFGGAYTKLEDVINRMLQQRRVSLLRAADGALVYKLLSEEKASKLQGLSKEQELIYQEIKKSGNKGVWTRKIRMDTNVQQQVLQKTLKLLEARQLIKSVKSVTARSKKLYMLYEEVPATEITGGAWYNDGEFDHEFVASMTQFVFSLIKQGPNAQASLEQLCNGITESAISRVQLSRADVQQIVGSLVLDDRVEEVPVVLSYDQDSGPVYRLTRRVEPPQFITEAPCGICSVADECSEGGAISPATCPYMQEWLKMSAEDDDGL